MTTMHQELKTALAAIEAAIPGIGAAYSQAPASISETDLPVFVNFLGEATHAADGSGTRREVRTVRARLYVCPSQGGVDGEAEARVEAWIEPCIRQFSDHPGLALDRDHPGPDCIQSADLIGDGGVQEFFYAGTAFLGVEFRFQVTIETQVEYAVYN